VTREGKWPLAVAVAVVLATVLLTACGSSDSDSSSSNEAASTSSSTTAQNNGGEQTRKGQSQSGPADKSKGQGEDSSSKPTQQGGGDSSKHTVAPLEVSGGGSAQFRTKGGDNSVQDFGEESESELQEVAEIVHGFYSARAEERWDAACSYLAKSNLEQLVKLVSQSPEQTGAGCSEALQAFTQPLPAALEREITTVDAGSFRREGEQGFLIYYGPERTVYSMPMREEGGTWKVAALSGSAIG
jgi:major membrane immunogen (membrane-anchored lipoprotein)